MRRALAAALCLALGACATVQTRQACLPLTPYTPAQQAALAAALGVLTPSSPIISAMEDYGAMRDADRACQSAGSPAKPPT